MNMEMVFGEFVDEFNRTIWVYNKQMIDEDLDDDTTAIDVFRVIFYSLYPFAESSKWYYDVAPFVKVAMMFGQEYYLVCIDELYKDEQEVQ